MKHKRLPFLFLTIVLLLCLGTADAFANSAISIWDGVNATGAIVTDEDCPLVVEHELLTFDIAEFPQSHYESEAEYLSWVLEQTGHNVTEAARLLGLSARQLFNKISAYGLR